MGDRCGAEEDGDNIIRAKNFTHTHIFDERRVVPPRFLLILPSLMEEEYHGYIVALPLWETLPKCKETNT